MVKNIQEEELPEKTISEDVESLLWLYDGEYNYSEVDEQIRWLLGNIKTYKTVHIFKKDISELERRGSAALRCIQMLEYAEEELKEALKDFIGNE